MPRKAKWVEEKPTTLTVQYQYKPEKKREIQTPIIDVSGIKTKNGIFGVEVDKDQFKASVYQILNLSPVWETIKLFPKFSVREIPNYAKLVVQVGTLAISAVELAKVEVLKQYPEGTKFSAQLALETAATILDESIEFTGIVGRLLDVADGAILKLIVNIIFGNRGGINWVSEAISILKLLIQ